MDGVTYHQDVLLPLQARPAPVHLCWVAMVGPPLRDCLCGEETNMVGRGCFGVPLVLNAIRARDRLRFAVWTRDLGLVKVGACVGLCISVAV
jgi:hypothetical protein